MRRRSTPAGPSGPALPRWAAALAVGAAAALVSPGSASASPQEVIGFGNRSVGMGNAGVAGAEGIDAVYHNPALLSASRELALELGLVGASFLLEAEGTARPVVAYPSLSATTIGGLLPLPFGGVLKDRVTIGLGFVTPTDVVVRGRILYPEKPQFLIADRVQTVAVQAGLGADIGYGIRIGGGFMAMAALTGSVTVATDASGRLGTVVEDTLVASFAPVAGASYEFDDYRIGLAFRGVLQGRFNVVIEAENLGQLEIPPLNISGVAQYDPWQISAGFAKVKGALRFGVGLTYKHWPAYPGPVEATVRCEDQPDPTQTCLAPLPPDVDFQPVASPRAGVEYRFGIDEDSHIAARGGYGFEPTPAPEQTGRTNYFDNHRSVFSLGYGIVLGGPGIAFDGYFQAQVLHARSHTQTVADGGEIDTTVDTRGAILGGGVSGRVSF